MCIAIRTSHNEIKLTFAQKDYSYETVSNITIEMPE